MLPRARLRVCEWHILHHRDIVPFVHIREKGDLLFVNYLRVRMIHVRRIYFFLIFCIEADITCSDSLSISSTEYQKLTVRILTPTVFSPVLIVNYSKIGPGFDLALQDIKLLYPSLDVVQELIFDPRISTCPE